MSTQRLSQPERQRLFDEYMHATGANHVDIEIFLAWLRPREDHPLWYRLFGRLTDAEAAHEWRVIQVRGMISDLRIVVNCNIPQSLPVAVKVPAFTTRAVKKSSYTAMDPDDPNAMREELSRGLSALRGWYTRHAGMATLLGCPVDAELGAAIAKLEDALTVAD